MNAVVTPPYDVIDEPLQEELYSRSPYNMIRLDLGRTEPGDDVRNNRYTRARDQLLHWLESGVLQQEQRPAVYYLEEDYLGVSGEPRTRKGFVASVRVEDAESGLYRPHEKTLAKPKEDRIRLTRQCRANLSPIFSLYDDPEMQILLGFEGIAKAAAPVVEVVDGSGVVTRMWCVKDPEAVRSLAKGIRGKSFFIADGHHRYETALAHRDWMRAQHPGSDGEEPWNYVMMYLSNMRDPGLTIFPTHRAVLGLEGLDVIGFLRRCEEYFRVEQVLDGETLLAAVSAGPGGVPRLGVCARGQPGGWVLTLRGDIRVDQLLGPEVPEVLHELDVTILHSIVLKRLLGISEAAQAEQSNLRYIKGGQALLDAVEGNQEAVQLGLLLNPTRIAQVKAVAEAGERMPQKSTFFYPKLVTGLVIHPLFRSPQELLGA